MCTMFKRGVLFRIAIAMASLAVFAFVVPPVALAFVPAKEAFHCLTQDDHGIGRQHHDESSDHHSSGYAEHAKHSHGDAEQRPWLLWDLLCGGTGTRDAPTGASGTSGL